MKHLNMFAILSTTAPLVEVVGDGPSCDLVGGLTVPDGAVTVAPMRSHQPIARRWRVDAPADVHTSVVVTKSPHGAALSVRRQHGSPQQAGSLLWQKLGGWPTFRRVRHALQRIRTLSGVLDRSSANDRGWCDIGGDARSASQVQAHGGDIVSVTFMGAHQERRHA